jgi:hypothetical protein
MPRASQIGGALNAPMTKVIALRRTGVGETRECKSFRLVRQILDPQCTCLPVVTVQALHVWKEV